ncbi:MAG TPA: WD40 repeat domain-containing protein, partial [Pilimelia sp.]|nr:WD40 repeat domain-containing protein [Pilimelia sp.]
MAEATLLVGAPSEAEVRRVVERPAARAGLDLDVGLIDAIVADAAGEPGALPLLSTALAELWERREGQRLTLPAYVTAGGIRGAVARMAERAYGDLDDADRSAARLLLLRLAGPGEGGVAVRRRVPLAELATLADGRASAVVEPLARARLLTVAAGHVEVAHEALFREWPRLRGWLDEDEAGRRLRQHLAPAALEWQARDEDEAELYRGPRLAAVTEWVRDHGPELTATERRFIAASQEAAEAEAGRRRRTVRRLRLLTAGLAAMLVLVAGAGYVAVWQRDRAAAAALAADARALRARAASTERLDHALLYSVQAHRYEPSGESRAGLLRVLQRSPEAVGMMLADVWPSRLAVSPDGQMIAAGHTKGTVYVWDTASHRLLATVPTTQDGINVLALGFHPDSRTLVVSRAMPDATVPAVSLVDLRATPPRQTDARMPPGALLALFTPDDTGLVTVFHNGTVGIVDAAGRLRRRLSPGLGAIDLNAYNPDLYTSSNGRYVVARALHGSLIWDLTNGRLVGRFPRDRHVMISPDGRYVAFRGDDGSVGVRDVATGKERAEPAQQTPQFLSATWASGGVAWAPDSTAFATISDDGAVRVWDPASLAVRATLRGHIAGARSVQYAVDGRTLYSGGHDRAVFAWDPTNTSRLADDFPVDVDVSGSLFGRFTADGRVFL